MSIRLKKSFMYILFFLMLYIFIYNPTFEIVGTGSIFILYLCSIFFFLLNSRYLNILKSHKVFSLCFISIIVYVFILVVFGADYIILQSFIVAFIECLIVPVFIVSFYIKHISKYDFYKTILIVGSIAAVISTFAFFIPNFNIALRSIQVTNEKFLLRMDRGYGLANELFFSYAIIQSIIFYIGIHYLRYCKWFVLFVPSFFLSVAFNARIGILMLFVSLVSYIFYNKNLKSYLVITLSAIVLIILILFIDLEEFNIAAFIWVRNFFYELNDFFFATQLANHNTLDILLQDMIVLPENIYEWFIGAGSTKYFISGGTDIGYLQMLNYGGIILLAMLSFLIFHMSVKIKKYSTNYFLWFFLSVVVISEFKGNFVPLSGGFRFLCLLYVFIIESNKIRVINNLNSEHIKSN